MAKQLLQDVCQELNLRPEDIKLERLGGLSNFVYRMNLVKGGSYVLKEFSHYFDCLMNRDFENQVCQLLGLSGLAPRIEYASAQGRVEEFLESTPVSLSDLQSRETLLQLANTLAELHFTPSVYMATKNATTGGGSIQEASAENKYYFEEDTLIKRLLSQKTKEAVREAAATLPEDTEIECVVGHIFSDVAIGLINNAWNDFKSARVFAHNDLNSTNMLHTKQQNGQTQLKLIDYEYANFNKRGFEFGNLFNELTMDYEYNEPPFFKHRPEWEASDEAKREFFANYLSSIKQNNAQNFDQNKQDQPDDGDYQENILIQEPQHQNTDIFYEKLSKLQLTEQQQPKQEKQLQQNLKKEQEFLQSEQSQQKILQEAKSEQGKSQDIEQQLLRQEIDQLLLESEQGRPFSHLLWLVVGLLSLKYKDLNIDLKAYIRFRYQYLRQTLLNK